MCGGGSGASAGSAGSGYSGGSAASMHTIPIAPITYFVTPYKNGPKTTYRKSHIGLNIVLTERLQDDKVCEERVHDTLIRTEPSCFTHNLYTRKLTEADLDAAQLNINGESRIAQDARNLIDDRKEYMRRKNEKDNEKNSNCKRVFI